MQAASEAPPNEETPKAVWDQEALAQGYYVA